MTDTKKMLIAIGAGLLAGAVLGVLYAPDEGAATRKKIAKKSRKLMGTVKNGIDDGRESLVDVKNALQRQLRSVNNKLEELRF